MASVTKYAGATPTQASSTTSNHYKQWDRLSYARTSENTYARCGADGTTFAGKNGTYKRPSLLSFKSFGFSIPSNADIDSVTVEYVDYVAGSSGAYPKLTAPTITIYNGTSKVTSKTGSTPSTSATQHSIKFTGISKSILSNLVVKLAYPSNANTNPGHVYLRYLRVKVEYTTPAYSYTINRVNTVTIHKDEVFDVDFTINNKNKTSENPTASINLPNGLTYVSKVSGDGTLTKNSASNLSWKTGLSKTKLQSKIRLRFKAVTVGNKTIGFQSTTLTVPVSPKPLNIAVSELSSNLIKSDETFNFNVYATSLENFTNDQTVNILLTGDYGAVTFLEDGTSKTITPEETPFIDDDGTVWNIYKWLPNVESKLETILNTTVGVETGVNVGSIRLMVQYTSEVDNSYKVSIYPEIVNISYYSGLIVKDSEIEKMGDGLPYIVSSNLFVEDLEDHYEGTIPDYAINHRLGVFNEDPYIIVDDPNGRSTSWANTGFTIDDSSSDYTILTHDVGTCNYEQNHSFNTNDQWTITFNYSHIEDTDLSSISVTLGDYTYTFTEIGITETSIIKFNYDGELLYSNVNDDVICIHNDFQPTSSYKFGFQSTEGSITFYNYKVKEENVTKTEDELISYAYEHCNLLSECPSAPEVWAECSTKFTYNSKYPIVVLFLGEPRELYPADVNLKFTNPCLSEVTDENQYEETGNHPSPFMNILSEEDYATVIGDSNKFVLYDFMDLENVETNSELVVRGLSVSFNYPNQEAISVLCSVKVNGVTGNRSLTLLEDEVNDSVVIGAEFDKWGLGFTDFVNLENLEITISSIGGKNTDGESTGTFTIDNPVVTVYYDNLNRTEHTVFVDGEDTRYYGLFVKNVDIPYGIKTSTDYLEIEGTDTDEAYRQNISRKEITIDFNIGSCNPVESTKLIQQVSKLFTNKRNAFNKPIPKKVVFGHLPNEYFEFLVEDGIDNSLNISNYDCSIKLIIPAGTSYSLEEVVTNITGANESLVKVNPLIKVTQLSSEITITEDYDNDNAQHWKIRDTNVTDDDGNHVTFTRNDYLEIDCLNREVTLYKYDSLNESYNAINAVIGVDYSSDWFILNGEYNFSCSGASIASISYRERW